MKAPALWPPPPYVTGDPAVLAEEWRKRMIVARDLAAAIGVVMEADGQTVTVQVDGLDENGVPISRTDQRSHRVEPSRPNLNEMEAAIREVVKYGLTRDPVTNTIGNRVSYEEFLNASTTRDQFDVLRRAGLVAPEYGGSPLPPDQRPHPGPVVKAGDRHDDMLDAAVAALRGLTRTQSDSRRDKERDQITSRHVVPEDPRKRRLRVR